MKKSFWGTLAFFGGILLGLNGCATPLSKRFQQIQIGMDKSQVLESVGNPKRTQRKEGGDIWTFVYYEGEQLVEKQVRFENGQVVSFGDSERKSQDVLEGM